MKQGKRILQVAGMLRTEISDVLRSRVKDPRIGFVSIIEVQVTSDLRHARVYFSIMGTEEEREKTFTGLLNAKAFIQKEIASRIHLRYQPVLAFFLDTRFDDYDKIERIINQINTGKKESTESSGMQSLT
jgi:ribosome-binding factor A